MWCLEELPGLREHFYSFDNEVERKKVTFEILKF